MFGRRLLCLKNLLRRLLPTNTPPVTRFVLVVLQEDHSLLSNGVIFQGSGKTSTNDDTVIDGGQIEEGGSEQHEQIQHRVKSHFEDQRASKSVQIENQLFQELLQHVQGTQGTIEDSEPVGKEPNSEQRENVGVEEAGVEPDETQAVSDCMEKIRVNSECCFSFKHDDVKPSGLRIEENCDSYETDYETGFNWHRIQDPAKCPRNALDAQRLYEQHTVDKCLFRIKQDKECCVSYHLGAFHKVEGGAKILENCEKWHRLPEVRKRQVRIFHLTNPTQCPKNGKEAAAHKRAQEREMQQSDKTDKTTQTSSSKSRPAQSSNNKSATNPQSEDGGKKEGSSC